MFDEHCVRAVRKDPEQLHKRKVIQPRFQRDMTSEQKRRSLSYLMFIKEKIYESIKGRGCVDSRPQQILMQKEDT